MKTTLTLLSAIAASCLIHSTALGRDVTLTIGGTGVSEVTIATNETAEIVSLFPIGNISGSSRLEVQKDGTTATFSGGLQSVNNLPVRVAGPATIKLSGPAPLFCTVQIDPATFPPDKTIVVPAGTPGANITLETSTDLVQWMPAAPGAYTNLHKNMFFRIRAERLP